MSFIKFVKILKTSFHKFFGLTFIQKILKMVPLEYTKKSKIIVVRQMQFVEYKALNSKLNCNFLSFGI